MAKEFLEKVLNVENLRALNANIEKKIGGRLSDLESKVGWLFVSSTPPTIAEGLRLGSLWVDLAIPVVKRTTALDPITFVEIEGTGGGAPADAEYLVGASHPDLSAERVVTNTPTVTWDLATAGQAKANVPAGAVAPSNAEYITAAVHADLSAERVATNTETITWDFATAGQAKANSQLIKKINGSSGVAGSFITWQRLTANSSDIATTTPTGIMTVTGLGLGTYRVRYIILYQSSATTTGVGFVLFNSVAIFHQNLWYHVTTGGTAATGVGDDDTVTVAGQMMEGKSEAVPAAESVIGSFSAGVAVVNSTIMAIIESIFTIDEAGDDQLDLRMASETGSAVRAMANSCMELHKLT